MYLYPEDILKLLLAVLVGGLIGAEREFRDKAAGFRTIILICVGATLFTSFSIKLSGHGDPARIAAQIVSGVGFLGAGTILRDRGRVTGLTTASTIWLAAAVGMGIGGGQYAFSIATALAVMVVLWIFPTVENWIDNLRHSRSYQITCPIDNDLYAELDDIFQHSALRVLNCKRIKSGDQMTCTWVVTGKPAEHDQVIQQLLVHEGIQEFHF